MLKSTVEVVRGDLQVAHMRETIMRIVSKPIAGLHPLQGTTIDQDAEVYLTLRRILMTDRMLRMS